jgi:hypothetical protein
VTWNGAYVLHLYCRYAPESDEAIAPPNPETSSGFEYDARHNNGPAEFTGNTLGSTRRSARRCGWRFNRDGEVTCPTCVKHGPGYKTVQELAEEGVERGGLAKLAEIAERPRRRSKAKAKR